MVKKLTAIFYVCVLLFSLAGCAGKGSDRDGGGGMENASGDEAETKGNITIRIMWQQEVTEQFWDLPLEKFKENHPDVQVEFESNAKAAEVIRNLLNVGEAPDIFYT